MGCLVRLKELQKTRNQISKNISKKLSNSELSLNVVNNVPKKWCDSLTFQHSLNTNTEFANSVLDIDGIVIDNSNAEVSSLFNSMSREYKLKYGGQYPEYKLIAEYAISLETRLNRLFNKQIIETITKYIVYECKFICLVDLKIESKEVLEVYLGLLGEALKDIEGIKKSIVVMKIDKEFYKICERSFLKYNWERKEITDSEDLIVYFEFIHPLEIVDKFYYM